MKQKETLSTTPLKEQHIDLSNLLIEEMGDEHKASSVETPLRADAFDKTDEEKITESRINQSANPIVINTHGAHSNPAQVKKST